MDTGPKIAQVAALVGDPGRANMLSALMDGRTLTASELAYVSDVAPQTASGHLAKLSDAGLLALERRGRRRYFRLASPLVARMLEGLMVVAQEGPARQRNLWRGGETLRHARTCYDCRPHRRCNRRPAGPTVVYSARRGWRPTDRYRSVILR